MSFSPAPPLPWSSRFFFFNDTATTEIYTLSLHDALPICDRGRALLVVDLAGELKRTRQALRLRQIEPFGSKGDRKSTRLNSSHGYISYAVFCLKKKKKNRAHYRTYSPRESNRISTRHIHI